MAKSGAVWGIDIGQCALKALRCKLDDDGETIVADAFDYIEYPKILSQPDAGPEELIKEALDQFLSRNELRGDRVVVSVSGQAGLSRFFKPPPVDSKTLPDIVKYEAKQQIPFALDEVIWDFQQIGGTVTDEGLIVDAEIGLFAMKRESVFRALQPFTDAEVEVDIVQLSPISIFNVVTNDILQNIHSPEDIDPANPPESLVVLSMGTDTTDLIITDGVKLWLRNIPIGGNHFTKQLSRELKLTYAKAEHLKRNARQAEDPKTIFQAMRPVFGDLVTEIQRSLSYFQGIDRNAHIGRIAILGNAAKLPALRQYLAKHLDVEIVKLSSYRHLSGASVVESKAFKENILSYGVCYGLCLQGLQKARLATNLLPQEFITERLVRAKKPWALASVGACLLAFSFHWFFLYNAWWSVNEKRSVGGVPWSEAFSKARDVKQLSGKYMNKDKSQMDELAEVNQIADAVIGVKDGRRLWPEMISAIYQAIPKDEKVKEMATDGGYVDPSKIPYYERKEIYIDHVESRYFTDLSEWYNNEVQSRYERDVLAMKSQGTPPADAGSAQTTPKSRSSNNLSSKDNELSKTAGWVIEIKGYHYFNGPDQQRDGNGGERFVLDTILKNLNEMQVALPVAGDQPMLFTFKELGVSHPVIVKKVEAFEFELPNVNHPNYTAASSSGGQSGGRDSGGRESGGRDASAGRGPGGSGRGPGGPGLRSGGSQAQSVNRGRGGSGGQQNNTRTNEASTTDSDEPEFFEAPKFEFILQFAWQPQGLSKRLEKRKEKEEEQRLVTGGQAGQPAAKN